MSSDNQQIELRLKRVDLLKDGVDKTAEGVVSQYQIAENSNKLIASLTAGIIAATIAYVSASDKFGNISFLLLAWGSFLGEISLISGSHFRFSNVISSNSGLLIELYATIADSLNTESKYLPKIQKSLGEMQSTLYTMHRHQALIDILFVNGINFSITYIISNIFSYKLAITWFAVSITFQLLLWFFANRGKTKVVTKDNETP